MKINILILICVFFCFRLNAINYSITQYSNLNGIKLSNVRTLAQDSTGFVWVGTENGLIRFDGIRFKKITAPIGYTVVNDITIESDDKIFVKWRNFPVMAYLPRKEKWQKLDSQFSLMTSGIEKNNVNLSEIDKLINIELLSPKLHNYFSLSYTGDLPYKFVKNNIIVGTENGLIHYDLLNKTYNTISLPKRNDQFVSLAKIKENIYVCLSNEIYKLINNEKLELFFKHNNSKNQQSNYCITHKNQIIYKANQTGIKSINVANKNIINYYHEKFKELYPIIKTGKLIS